MDIEMLFILIGAMASFFFSGILFGRASQQGGIEELTARVKELRLVAIGAWKRSYRRHVIIQHQDQLICLLEKGVPKI